MKPFKKVSCDEIKRLINPVDFYSSELSLFKTNHSKKWINSGLCPFHTDRHVGSFCINAASGGFQCHSCGAKGSDIIRFVQEKYQIDFKSALNKLINDWGI